MYIMNRKQILFIFSLICLINLSSCNSSTSSSNSNNNISKSSIANSSTSHITSSNKSTSNIATSSISVLEKFTVIWQNFDGSILEEDLNVHYGTLPSYDGETPKKEGKDETIYIFSGWTPEISEVKEDVTYVATFNEVTSTKYAPTISLDQKTIEYGYYPQSYVSDESLINNLNLLCESTSYGWYLYEGNYYVKEEANVYKNESFTFNDGTSISNGLTYWFKCEPITWTILNNKNDTYYLLSSLLLDVQKYYNSYEERIIENETIYANNYEHSDIRSWLNDEFYNSAFYLNNAYIQKTLVDNSSFTSDNENNIYSYGNTNDKVYLPSYENYLNKDYGFDSVNDKSNTRTCKVTDYAIAKGAWYNTSDNLKYNGTYWTRTATSEYSYCAWNVNSGGYLSAYAIDGDSHSVRPCISITFDNN